MKRIFLAAKISFIFAMMLGNLPLAQAGIPTFDGANITQTVISAKEAVVQTIQQIQQYQTQLQQLEDQLKHGIGPSAQIWDQAQSTIDNLLQATDTLAYYESQFGNIDAYLDNFQDVDYYRSSPCFTSTGCSDAEWAALNENRNLASKSQKKANDALFKGLKQQQDNLKADARQLNRLQAAAQGADGQLAAIGYANQLASNQANQLLQIRSLLIAQQNAIATQMQAKADKEAQQQAAAESLRKGRFVPSTGQKW